MPVSKYHTSEQSGEIFEKFSVKPVLFVASVVMVFITVCLIYPLFFSPKIHVLTFLSFYSSYIFTFLILYVIVYLILVFIYRHQSLQMKTFSEQPILGLKPIYLVCRTGVRLIDIFGMIVGIALSVLCYLKEPLRFLFPLFLFFSFAFISALYTGPATKWQLKRREKF